MAVANIAAKTEGHTQNPPPAGSINYWPVLAPFVPVLIAGLLKLALLDDVPSEKSARDAYLLAQYAKPLWLELLISAYILPVAALMTNDTLAKKLLGELYLIPAIALVLCLFLVFGLPKIQVVGVFWQIILPAAL